MCAARFVLVPMGQNFRGGEGVLAPEMRRAGSDHLLPIHTTMVAAWTNILPGHGGRDTGVQRERVGYMSSFPANPTTPGNRIVAIVAWRASGFLPINRRRCRNPITPLSYQRCVAYIFNTWPGQTRHANGQGALPSRIHVGPGPVRVKMHLKQDYQFRTLWDVHGPVPWQRLAGVSG